MADIFFVRSIVLLSEEIYHKMLACHLRAHLDISANYFCPNVTVAKRSFIFFMIESFIFWSKSYVRAMNRNC